MLHKYRPLCAKMIAIGLLKFCLPKIASIHLLKLLLSPIFDVLFAFLKLSRVWSTIANTNRDCFS